MDIAPDHLNFLLLALAGYRAVLPQVGRMMTGADVTDQAEAARRLASVVEAARRLVES